MNNYTIIEQLGEGSFGQVYKAKLNELHKSDLVMAGVLDKEQSNCLTYVALKIISIRSRLENDVKILWKECEIQRSLKHPNIIQMFEAFRTENEIVVITEFAHKTLCAVLNERSFLQEDRVRKITCDLVSALYYLHTNNIIHRDLKPQNVLLDRKEQAKLCDFGFAKLISNDSQLLTSIKGTPLYMAPEIFFGKPYDYTADLWSLGCIVYEMLIGLSPFHTTCYFELIESIKTKDIKWPRAISLFCDSFLKGLLQKVPSKRFHWDQIISHPFVCDSILVPRSQSQPDDKNDSSSGSERASLTDKLRSSCSSLCTFESQHDESDSSSTSGDNNGQEDYRIDESIGFLVNSLKEIMNNDFQSLTNSICTKVLLMPITQYTSNLKVLNYTIYTLSMPFFLNNIREEILKSIETVYLELNIIDLLLTSIVAVIKKKSKKIRSKYLQSFHNLFQLFLNRLLNSQTFADHFCLTLRQNEPIILLIHDILLKYSNSSIAKTIISILIELLKNQSNSIEIIEAIIWQSDNSNGSILISYLQHENSIFKLRICYLICLLIDRKCKYLKDNSHLIEQQLTVIGSGGDVLKPNFFRNVSQITLNKLKIYKNL